MLTIRGFFLILSFQSPCCSIAEYRICLDKAVSRNCKKNIDRIALIKSNVNTKLIFHGLNAYEKKHCGMHGARITDCADNMEICEKILFIFVFITFLYAALYVIEWIVSGCLHWLIGT